jgi:hypothetical protein
MTLSYPSNVIVFLLATILVFVFLLHSLHLYTHFTFWPFKSDQVPGCLFTFYCFLKHECVGGTIAQLVRPLAVTPEVPGSILGYTLWIFQRHFQCFPPN